MKIFYHIDDVQGITHSMITIGNFDGVHLAHQKIIKDVVSRAKESGGTSILITFHPHPLKYLKNVDIKLLQTTRQKLEIIEWIGIDMMIMLTFDDKLANITALDFVEKILIEKLKMEELFIGYNFHFGKNKEGDINVIRQLAQKHNFIVHVQEPVIIKGILCNSTTVRNLLENGDIENATNLLDRYFSIRGTVVSGEKLGRKLGFPTVNIEPENDFFPHTGVYLTYLNYNGIVYPSVTNVGYSPTVEKKNITIESYILNFNEKIYGKKVSLLFIRKMRDEIKFNSLNQLSEQISRDVEYARLYFGIIEKKD